jgi:hypothetical protein
MPSRIINAARIAPLLVQFPHPAIERRPRPLIGVLRRLAKRFVSAFDRIEYAQRAQFIRQLPLELQHA